MCAVLLPLGDNPITVNKYIISYHISYQELSEMWSEMYKTLHVKCPLFLSDFHLICIFSTSFRKTLNIKFHENPPSAVRVVSWGRTDMSELIVSFRNFGNAPSRSFVVWVYMAVFLHPKFLDAVQCMTVRLSQNGHPGKICIFSKSQYASVETLMTRLRYFLRGVKPDPGYSICFYTWQVTSAIWICCPPVL
jgi:hypothetical protein